MAILEDVQHDILLIIIAGLFILFSSGLAIPLRTPAPPVIVPRGL